MKFTSVKLHEKDEEALAPVSTTTPTYTATITGSQKRKILRPISTHSKRFIKDRYSPNKALDYDPLGEIYQEYFKPDDEYFKEDEDEIVGCLKVIKTNIYQSKRSRKIGSRSLQDLRQYRYQNRTVSSIIRKVDDDCVKRFSTIQRNYRKRKSTSVRTSINIQEGTSAAPQQSNPTPRTPKSQILLTPLLNESPVSAFVTPSQSPIIQADSIFGADNNSSITGFAISPTKLKGRLAVLKKSTSSLRSSLRISSHYQSIPTTNTNDIFEHNRNESYGTITTTSGSRKSKNSETSTTDTAVTASTTLTPFSNTLTSIKRRLSLKSVHEPTPKTPPIRHLIREEQEEDTEDEFVFASSSFSVDQLSQPSTPISRTNRHNTHSAPTTPVPQPPAPHPYHYL